MDAGRKSIWTLPELEASLPVMLPAAPDWVLSASHRPEAAARGVTLAGWSSGVPQQPGMWFQVELPAPTMITEVQFDAAAAGRLGGGGRGRGAAAAGRGAAAGAARGAAAAAPAPTPGFPREFQIEVSLDGKSFGAPVAKGPGSSLTLASFAPVRAKFIRITQTAAAAPDVPAWSIQNLRIYEAPAAARAR